MYGLLNVGSLILGLIAWILPLITLSNASKTKNPSLFSFISLSACATSICFQLFYQTYLVKIKDWGAVEDTIYTVACVSFILLVSTVLLNGIVHYKFKRHA